jgi:hypothetical protein
MGQRNEGVEEPENSTVDDWFGQNVARDQDVADEALAAADGDAEKAEQIYDERATGQDTYEAGHPD